MVSFKITLPALNALKIKNPSPIIAPAKVGVKLPASGKSGVGEGVSWAVGVGVGVGEGVRIGADVGVGVGVGVLVGIGVAVGVGVAVEPDGVDSKAGPSAA